ncbi:hypothetical protein H4Q26_014157 [Puccinia striiformis f. sp. tritici PST-130]|uniref:Uncharacterized protein n=2 Tax=Puccinia striiformis TaxID=27350 RepID=A0A0L0VVA6_9BASI|nr:hypothetical protein H4Q26_003300 [Puccinia striiformis f. sp. tritici PST-130]KAI9619773.1 hypothetical protein H4Q26_014157 [Puccinia striiformis f. sp. tritici PST-130]KNF03127.1 hypothetical protein PSTG_03712 [Puccinia striiformis f. sp. tritici PST-78]POW10966.1 hypothetical protein PSTT_05620 [Puccinia striiformis]
MCVNNDVDHAKTKLNNNSTAQSASQSDSEQQENSKNTSDERHGHMDPLVRRLRGPRCLGIVELRTSHFEPTDQQRVAQRLGGGFRCYAEVDTLLDRVHPESAENTISLLDQTLWREETLGVGRMYLGVSRSFMFRLHVR